ncbi:MAG: ABC transporter ATP-binding protein/permease [Anaerolineaceae bacterium]|nr:ABC transporter ATP-binding protein/permease [Anaerolineaceae bacterium]
MIKRFLSYYKNHMKLFTLDMVAAFGLAAIELVYPAVTTRLIDVYIPERMINQILIMGVVLLGIYLIMAGLNFFMNYWGHVMGVNMEADMRSDFFRHLQSLPFKFYDQHRTGKLMSRLVNDLNMVTEMAHHGPEDLFISVVMFVGSFFILFQMQWIMAVAIYIVAVPVLVWFSITQRAKMSNAFREVRESMADINAQLENSLSGVRVAKSYTNEGYEIERFNIGNGLFRLAKKKAYKRMATFMTGMGFLISFLNVLVLVLGGVFAYRNIITIGELTGFLLYINLVMQPIRRLTNFTQQFEQGMNGFVRFDSIMRIQPDIIGGDQVLEHAEGHIVVDALSFSYNGEEEILTNISLEIVPDTTVALVGPSGGGKTTLCHLIPRFYDVQSGEILIDGTNIREYTLESLRSNIGLVQQDVFLFTGTVRENILYGRSSATEEEMITAAKSANIHDFVVSQPYGYDTWIGEKGVLLSGGQKQRISIARVFLKNPPILILDEATSSLDNETEMKIQESLETLSEGRTTLVIAHRLSTIRNADVIIVLSDEGIIERGNHKDLYAIEDGVYKRLYDAQFYADSQKVNKNRLFA